MKIALLLVTAVFAFSSCTTLTNRRDLYSPGKPNGPRTKELNKTSGVIGPTI